MSGTLAVLDFLNSREKAVLVWAVLLFVLVLAKSDGLLGPLGDVARALVAPKLLLAFGSAALYSALLLWLASEGGLWQTTAAKASVYWFFGTGVILVARAIDAASPDQPIPVRRFVREALKFSIVTDFMINLYSFPFAAELFLVPLVLFFVGMQAFAESDPTNKARPVIDGVLIFIGVMLLSYFAVRVINNPGGLFTRETAEDFFVAPALSLALVPYLCLVAWYSRRELRQLRKRWPTLRSPA